MGGGGSRRTPPAASQRRLWGRRPPERRGAPADRSPPACHHAPGPTGRTVVATHDAADPETWMRRALDLAARGLGTTSPNPMVGAVLVREGEVVGEGFHRAPGEPHAEALALQRAAGRAAGATCYVTLRRCHHDGRTRARTGA